MVSRFFNLSLIFSFIFLFGCSKSDDKNETVPDDSEASLLPSALTASIKSELDQSSTIKSALVLVDGETALEYYANGASNQSLLHIRSITKSLTSLLIGQAIENEEIEGTHLVVKGYFPNDQEAFNSEYGNALNIQHLLDMQSGFEWNETEEAITWYSTITEPYEYIFSKGFVEAPGTRFNYNSGAVSLLRDILEQSTEKSLTELIETRLFEPMEISSYTWEKGLSRADAGLSVRPMDLAKIGLLLLNNGLHDGQRLISQTWLEESWTFQLDLESSYGPIENVHYHNLWWMGEYNDHKVYFGLGYGGQLLVMVPAKQVVMVTNHDYLAVNSHLHSRDFLNKVFAPIMDVLD